MRRLKFFIFILNILCSQITACDDNCKKKYETKEFVLSNNETNNEKSSKKILFTTVHKSINHFMSDTVHISTNNSKKIGINITSKTVVISNTTYLPTTSTIQMTNTIHVPSMYYGAFLRSIFVIIGLSAFVIVYIVFRGFRLNKKSAQMVRKYGVLTHRQDVEMKPLPLDKDDDDDDDTIVFNASNVSSNKQLQL